MGCPAEKATSVQFCNVAHLNFDSTSNLLGGKACNHSNGLQSINYEGEVRELWKGGCIIKTYWPAGGGDEDKIRKIRPKGTLFRILYVPREAIRPKGG